MAEQNTNIDYELVTKYLSGEADQKESEQVELWIKASETNAKSYEQLKKLWKETGRIFPNEPSDVNVDKAWNKFHNRINNEKLTSKTLVPQKERSLFYYLTRVAAILIVGIIIYSMYDNIRERSSNIQLSTSDETVTDTLSDGSIISLNSKSNIKYPRNFKSDTRTVQLSGEAYFSVTPDPNKPFIVNTSEASIQVVGTSFYVRNYDSLSTIEIGVEKGEVIFNAIRTDSTFNLMAGESIIFNKMTKQIEAKEDFDPNELFWKTNTLIFQNTQLSEVFNTLENKYGIRIEVTNRHILNCRLTAKFSREEIDQIMEIINTNFNFNSEHTDDQFVIYGEGCH